jgi:hypothetical protein
MEPVGFERRRRRVSWYRRFVQSIPTLIVVIVITNLISFSLWVVRLEARLQVAENQLHEVQERMGRVVQALDVTYEKLMEHMREMRPPNKK